MDNKDKDTVGDIINVVGFITSVLFYLSHGVLPYKLMFGKVKVEDTSSFTIVCTLLDSILFFLIGVRVSGELNYLIWRNYLSVALCLVFEGIFLYYYSKGNKLNFFLYLFFFINVAIEIGFIENDLLDAFPQGNCEKVIKYIASIINCCMYITPGMNLFRFFYSWNYKYLKIENAITGIFDSGIWLAYDIHKSKQTEDFRPGIIFNSLSAIFCLFQIVFYFFNRGKNTPSISDEYALIEKLHEGEGKRKETKLSPNDEVLDFI